MIDIIPKIIAEINSSPLAFQKVYSPDFYVVEWETAPMPAVSVAERWWNESWYHRVLFVVRWANIWVTRPLAIQLITLMEAMPDKDLKRQKINWWIDDKLLKWWAETIFYMLFYEADSD